MIISHHRRFILVKSRKTASSSIELAIVPQLGRQDVWTPMSLPPLAGQNYYSLWPIDVLSAKSGLFRNLVGRDSRFHHRFYHDHISLKRIRRTLPAEQFTGYRKFAFDRNPWDFVVSLYFFQRRKGVVANLDFDRFLYEHPIVQNWELYTEDNEILADRVFRFEDISLAMKEIAAETGLTLDTLPSEKRGYRNGSDYRSFYSASSRDLVAARWAKTIALLNYDF